MKNEEKKWGMRGTLTRMLTPVIKIVGKISFPFLHKVAINDYYPIRRTIKPLDVILSSTKGYLSNVFNTGPWKHAILYIGEEDGVPMIIEAIGEGVVKKPLVVCLADKDKVAVVRMKEKLTAKNVKAAIKWANEMVGKPYDYSFESEGAHKFDNFYCSELVYIAWQKAKKDLKFQLRKIMGMETVDPEDFYNAAEKGKTEIIFETKGHH